MASPAADVLSVRAESTQDPLKRNTYPRGASELRVSAARQADGCVHLTPAVRAARFPMGLIALRFTRGARGITKSRLADRPAGAVLAAEESFGLGAVGDLHVRMIPLDLAAGTERHVPQVVGDRQRRRVAERAAGRRAVLIALSHSWCWPGESGMEGSGRLKSAKSCSGKSTCLP